MTSPLKGKSVLVIGRGGGIARAIALAAGEAGGQVIAAGRHPDTLADSYRGTAVAIEQPDGSLLFLSGATALKPAPGMLAVAATNAAVDAVTAGLAVELAPVRVNAIAPGTVDTGAYDAQGKHRCSRRVPRPTRHGALARPTTSRPRR